jgi:UV DNA damage endonuclease
MLRPVSSLEIVSSEEFAALGNSQITPKLGLVCITASNQVRYRTLTRKRLLLLSEAEQEKALRDLYAENLRRLGVAVEFCAAEEIHLYRVASGLFPFADEPLGAAILTEFSDSLRQASASSCIPNSLSYSIPTSQT